MYNLFCAGVSLRCRWYPTAAVVLDGRVLEVVLASVTPIHLTLYIFQGMMSLLCMWYSTAAVVLDGRGGARRQLWYSTVAVVLCY